MLISKQKVVFVRVISIVFLNRNFLPYIFVGHLEKVYNHVSVRQVQNTGHRSLFYQYRKYLKTFINANLKPN